MSFVDTLILKMQPERVQKVGSGARSIHSNARHAKLVLWLLARSGVQSYATEHACGACCSRRVYVHSCVVLTWGQSHLADPSIFCQMLLMQN